MLQASSNCRSLIFSLINIHSTCVLYFLHTDLFRCITETFSFGKFGSAADHCFLLDLQREEMPIVYSLYTLPFSLAWKDVKMSMLELEQVNLI